MKETKDGEHYKISAKINNDKLKLTEFVQGFMPNTAASTPDKIKPYYTELDEAVKFIGFTLYVVRSKDETRYCQSDTIAREFIAELKAEGKMYVYFLCKSPNQSEQIECWLPPPAQK
jgi:hypothetical protein